jgi:hypothetical protein
VGSSALRKEPGTGKLQIVGWLSFLKEWGYLAASAGNACASNFREGERKMKLVASAIIAILLCIAPSFATAVPDTTEFSGFELFAGIKLDGVTIGATFSGWTDTSTHWVPFTKSTGGFVSGSINYSGKPGFGNSVEIFGGRWSWFEADERTIHSGPVSSGSVQWPTGSGSQVPGSDCGNGIAVFTADVADAASGATGTITGCLNDQLTFPPKIWGDIDLPLAP